MNASKWNINTFFLGFKRSGTIFSTVSAMYNWILTINRNEIKHFFFVTLVQQLHKQPDITCVFFYFTYFCCVLNPLRINIFAIFHYFVLWKKNRINPLGLLLFFYFFFFFCWSSLSCLSLWKNNFLINWLIFPRHSIFTLNSIFPNLLLVFVCFSFYIFVAQMSHFDDDIIHCFAVEFRLYERTELTDRLYRPNWITHKIEQ